MKEGLRYWSYRLDCERTSLVIRGKEVIAVVCLLPLAVILACNDTINAVSDVLRIYRAQRLIEDGKPVPEGFLNRRRT